MHTCLDVSLNLSGCGLYTLTYFSVFCLSFCPFGGLGLSSLSTSSRLLALLHAAEGDVNDRN